MKRSQIAMLGDLQSVWMERRDKKTFDYFVCCKDRGNGNEFLLYVDVVRRLWNRYQMQIRAIRKNAKRGAK